MDGELWPGAEKRLGVHFEDPRRLRDALTHPSYFDDDPLAEGASFVRGAVVGMALLEALVTFLLEAALPDLDPELLRELRTTVASRSTVAEYARELQLGRTLRMSARLRAVGGEDRDELLHEAFSALVAAWFSERGWTGACALVRPLLEDVIQAPEDWRDDPKAKSALMTFVVKHGLRPHTFRELASWGPPHAPCFKVGILVGEELLGQGEGRSKKLAEVEAARKILRRLKLEALQLSVVQRASVVEELAFDLTEGKLGSQDPLDQALPRAEGPQGAPDDSPVPSGLLLDEVAVADPLRGRARQSLEHLIESVRMDTAADQEDRLDRERARRRGARGLHRTPREERAARIPQPIGHSEGMVLDLEAVPEDVERLTNPKGALQEFLARLGWDPPTYRLDAARGPAHAPRFQVAVLLEDRVQGCGEGSSRKEADQAAARDCLRNLHRPGMKLRPLWQEGQEDDD